MQATTQDTHVGMAVQSCLQTSPGVQGAAGTALKLYCCWPVAVLPMSISANLAASQYSLNSAAQSYRAYPCQHMTSTM